MASSSLFRVGTADGKGFAKWTCDMGIVAAVSNDDALDKRRAENFYRTRCEGLRFSPSMDLYQIGTMAM